MAFRTKRRKRRKMDSDSVKIVNPNSKKESGVSTESAGFGKFDKDF